MIRRRAECGFVLVSHEQCAGQAAVLARCLGGAFAPPADRDCLFLAAAHAFDGLAELDAAPPLSPAGQPLQFEELPVLQQIGAWDRTTRLAQQLEPRSAALLGLHALQWSSRPELHRGQSQRDLFAFNRQQHLELERLERLRPTLGLRNDVPTHFGLPEMSVTLTPAEVALHRDLSLLRLVIELAGEACSHSVISRCIGYFAPAAGVATVAVQSRWRDEEHLEVANWPFATGEVRLTIIRRVVPARRYGSAEELQAVIGQTPTSEMSVLLTKGLIAVKEG